MRPIYLQMITEYEKYKQTKKKETSAENAENPIYVFGHIWFRFASIHFQFAYIGKATTTMSAKMTTTTTTMANDEDQMKTLFFFFFFGIATQNPNPI